MAPLCVRPVQSTEGKAALLAVLDAHVPRSHALRAILRHDASAPWGFFELQLYAACEAATECVPSTSSHAQVGVDSASARAMVAIIHYPHSGMHGVYTFAIDAASLEPLLEEGACFSWRCRTVFAAMQGAYTHVVESASLINRRPLEITPCVMYLLRSIDTLPRLDAASIHPARIGPLTEAHAEIVNKHWPYGSASTEINVRRSITCFGGAGVFVGDEPVAWAVFQPYGAIGMVHTMDDHRRKGYGSAAVRALIDNIRDGATPIDAAFCYIVRGNDASVSMMTSLGFEEVANDSHDWWVPVNSPSD
eukprot:Opistho-2@29302